MTPARGSLHVFDTPDALAQGVADLVLARAQAAGERFVLALSGGSTPRGAYRLLAAPPRLDAFPWSRTQFVFGDERFVPPDSADSNARMANEAMLARAPVSPGSVHPVPTTGITADAAARDYERTLQKLYGADTLDPARPLLDLTLLGIGDDGHTASLIPGEPAVAERTRWVVTVPHGRAETRITLTLPVLDSSRAVAFLVSGEGKRAILDRVLSGDTGIPAGMVNPSGDLLFLADRAAAGRYGGGEYRTTP